MKKTVMLVLALFVLAAPQGPFTSRAMAQSPEQAAASAARDNYGAIAYGSRSGRWGYSYDFPSRVAAENYALEQCAASDCKVVVWFRNACGALATSENGFIGWGWAYSREEAEKLALDGCYDAGGSGCRIQVWACTTR